MQAIDYLKYIVDEIHSTVFATVDQAGRPVTLSLIHIYVYKRQVS